MRMGARNWIVTKALTRRISKKKEAPPPIKGTALHKQQTLKTNSINIDALPRRAFKMFIILLKNF
jgi:hypothetical protein